MSRISKQFLFVILIVGLVGLIAGLNGSPVRGQEPSTATSAATETVGLPGKWAVIHQQTVEASTYLYAAAFLDDKIGVVTGGLGETRYTSDGGNTWLAGANGAATCYGLDVVSPDLMVTVADAGNVHFSADAGKTWAPAADLGDSGLNHNVSFVDAQTGWAGSAKRLWATSDGGKTWQEINLPDGVAPLLAAIDLRTATDGYLLTFKGDLFTTADGGKTWASQPLDLGDQHLDVSSYPALRFLDDHLALIAVRLNNGDSVVLKSGDGGKTWSRETLPVQTDQANFFLSHDGTILTLLARSDITVIQYQPTNE